MNDKQQQGTNANGAILLCAWPGYQAPSPQHGPEHDPQQNSKMADNAPMTPVSIVQRPRPSLPATLLIAVIVGLILTLVYSAIWFGLSRYGLARVENWITDHRAKGFRIDHAEIRVNGYPFHIRITVANPVISSPEVRSPDSGGPWTWGADHIRGTVRPWRLDHIQLTAPGRHRFDFMVDARRQSYIGRIETLDANIQFNNGKARTGSVSLRGLAMKGSIGGIVTVDKARASVDVETISPDGGELSVLRIEANNLRLPNSLSMPLGNHIKSLSVRGKILGSPSPAKWPNAAKPDVLATWRDNGGTVEVERFNVDYGPLSLQSNGTIALDRDLQPIASFTAKISGFFEILDVMRKQGFVNSRDTLLAKLLLGAMAKRPSNGGPATINIPLTLQDRKVYAGPVRLGTMAVIDW